MEIDWGDPKSVTLLGLDALTILILAVQGLRHWKQCSRACRELALKTCKMLANCWRCPEEDMGVLQKYHTTLVNMMRRGCLFMSVALFFRLVAIQPALLSQRDHSLQPALDVTNMISYPLCVIIALVPQVLMRWTMDLWYIILQGLCVAPLLLAEPEEVPQVSLITAFPRMLCGIGASSGFLAVFGNLINCLASVYLSEDGAMVFVAELFMVLACIVSMRWGLYENVMMSCKLNSRSIELGAVSRLLLGVCDAVVEIDSSLSLTEDSRQLSALLLHNQGMTSGGLAGRDFLSFFCKEDRPRIQESLSQTYSETPLAPHARMLDCLGSNLHIELLHCDFENIQGERCFLVGMREFQDSSSQVPSLAPLLCETSVPKGSVLLFDAESMKIIGSENCEHWCKEGLEGTSLMDLPTGGNLDDVLTAIQEAVNNIYETRDETYGPVHFDNLELFSTKLKASLKLQRDFMLQTLVGTLSMDPRSTLTMQNLAKLATVEKSRKSRRKRNGSKASSGSRTSGSSGGSILSLRRMPCSL